MGERRRWPRFLVSSVAALVWLCCASEPVHGQQPNTFTVTSTGDSGAGSLRQAITDANATPNVAGQPDRIVFNIMGTGVQTIRPTTVLPAIREDVVVDGYTQSGASANTLGTGDNAVLRIRLDGTGVAPPSSGITVLSSSESSTPCSSSSGVIGSTISGLVITGWSSGVVLAGRCNHVEGSFIGIDPTGTTASPNGAGVDVNDAPDNVVGGTAPAARNVISGNGSGIRISADLNEVGAALLSKNNRVQGNYVGSNSAGTAAVPNGSGIVIGRGTPTQAPPDTVIGGTEAGAGNLILGNSTYGINHASGTGTVIQGNSIRGTTSFSGVGHANAGVRVAVAQNVTVGGAAPGAGNFIAFGSAGPVVGAVGLWLTGDGTGTRVFGNTITGNSGDGVLIEGAGFTVGGTTDGDANAIMNNGLRGVEIRPGNNLHGGNEISGNSIVSNGFTATNKAVGGLGIDLEASSSTFGVTPNDPGDADAANGFQNYPVLTSALTTSVAGNGDLSVTVQGSLDTTGGLFRVEYFANRSCDDSTDGQLKYGEGERFVGSATVLNPSTGVVALPSTTLTVPQGYTVLTATATSSLAHTAHTTSELSACRAITVPTLTVDDHTIQEPDTGTADVTFTVTLAPTSGQQVTVQFATADGTAIAGKDYQATSGTLVFAPGVSQRSLPVKVIGDTLHEPDETFVVNLTNATGGAVIADGQGQGTIVDNDPPVPGVTVSPTAGLTTTEAGGKATFTVQLDTVPTAPVTIALSSSDTTEGTVGPTSLTFQPNTTALDPQTVTVTGIDDPEVDGNVAYTIATAPATSADSAYNGRNPPDVGVVNLDNERVATLTIADARVAEGNLGTRTVRFAVSLAPPTTQRVTVEYATADGTATAGSDYVAATGTLVFTPGATQQPIDVTVIGDTQYEGDETFFVNLTAPTGGAVIGDGQGLGTIEEDDLASSHCSPRPAVQVAPAPEAGGGLQVTITATSLPATLDNRLSALHFLPGNNTVVTLPSTGGDQKGITGELLVPLPERPVSVIFIVRPVIASQPMQLPFLVVDGCGEWETFVGRGTGGTGH